MLLNTLVVTTESPVYKLHDRVYCGLECSNGTITEVLPEADWHIQRIGKRYFRIPTYAVTLDSDGVSVICEEDFISDAIE